MPRFFRRHAEGVFDLDDLRLRARQLAGFITEARAAYHLGEIAPIAVGFSNGANIGAALLLLHPGTLSGAVLLRPMVPLVPDPLPSLDQVRVLIAAGRHDPIVRPQQSQELAELLQKAGAEVSLHWSGAGHNLTTDDLQAAERWMAAAAMAR
jgi:predicted esterase